MIANERQYRIANTQLGRFQDALAAHDAGERSDNIDPRVHQAMRDAIASERDELHSQLRRYENLRSGRVTKRTLDSLRELPVALIEARIAAQLTQRELGERLGVPEQQIQRWEANTYASVGVERLQEIADALRLEIHETITYATRGEGSITITRAHGPSSASTSAASSSSRLNVRSPSRLPALRPPTTGRAPLWVLRADWDAAASDLRVGHMLAGALALIMILAGHAIAALPQLTRWMLASAALVVLAIAIVEEDSPRLQRGVLKWPAIVAFVIAAAFAGVPLPK